jgi:hypothetical protein
MAGTIIADFIRTDANQLSLNVGNTTFATINASGFFSNTGTQLIAANGAISGASVIAGSIPAGKLGTASVARTNMGYTGAVLQTTQSGAFSGVQTTSGSTQFSSTTPSITPTSSSNKILLLWSTGVQIDVDNDSQGSNNGSVRFEYQIGGTGGAWSLLAQFSVPGRGGNGTFTNAVFILSPATTSAVFFRMGISKNEGARSIQLSDSWGSNQLFMMEIAG